MRHALPPSNRPRRGVTLVEMLVVVALVILMMTILVQVFQAALGAMSASRAVQELDVALRQVDYRLRQDLAGVTAKLTPPLNPLDKLGYFEYGENAFADAQGEDTDDYLAFTTKAPEGQVFTGRVYIPGVTNSLGYSSSGNKAIQPILVTSQLAEVIYFLRNGNLYRRVFLIVPERQSSVTLGTVNVFPALYNPTLPAAANSGKVGWLAVNDISMRPAPTGGTTGNSLLNDLGDLSNRENRAFRPRFRSDFFNTAGNLNPDGIDDDFNADDLPDFYPTLYPNVLDSTNGPGLVHELPYSSFNSRTIATLDVHPFPYIYPGMYSQPETKGAYSLGTGWIHSLDPSQNSYTAGIGNHSPLIASDNLTIPNLTAGQTQTWWGFPTWRETLAIGWLDPVLGHNLSNPPVQQLGLQAFSPNAVPNSGSTNFLPPVFNQLANDGAGSNSFAQYINLPGVNVPVPGVWDDDLIMTNVRSFDVKAFDHDAPLYSNPSPPPPTPPAYLSAGYYDLGYGLQTDGRFANQSPQLQGFGHAGRIPPLVNDNRVDPSRPLLPNGFANNIGDNGANVIRLSRVWDSWSTDYSHVQSVDINGNGNPNSVNPLPVYPSYPAPYQSQLRGIQIQIRVTDPRNERVKVLTIRQDFTDKL